MKETISRPMAFRTRRPQNDLNSAEGSYDGTGDCKGEKSRLVSRFPSGPTPLDRLPAGGAGL